MGNHGPSARGEMRVQLREVTDAGYDVKVSDIEEVVEEHSYGYGHVSD